MDYLVVETYNEYNEPEVCVVPRVWVEGKYVLWPPGPNSTAKAKQMMKPRDNWQKCKFSTLKEGIRKLSFTVYNDFVSFLGII